MSDAVDISPLTRLLASIDARADGTPASRDAIATGFPSLDRLLGGGVRAGDLAVLGGDVGVGKSALALAIALRASGSGARVCYLSGEMTRERILERALAIEGKASIDDLRRGTLDDETRAALGAAAHRLRPALPLIETFDQPGTHNVLSVMRELERGALVVVDALQSLASGAPALDEKLADALVALKEAALSMGQAVLLTAHLPAHTRARPNPRPTLDDFGAAGGVKHHADIVLGLYREELYTDGAPEGATELAILKNRNGPLSYVDLYYYKRWLRFEDMVD
ncbi:MAG TPA: DnaB-like helicase C-terminal domain-containing protein [Gemmatimonadaceae bacterium]|nr:DnaB-like helicase C-terminal domain-containing protein [Gemmatimonadaceae bacterium]